jgi:uncharacterized protein (TIGR02466 family)
MIDLYSQPLFVSSIAKAVVHSFDKPKLIETIFQLEKTVPSAHRSNAGGWQSPHYDHTTIDNPYVFELIQDNIMPALHEVAGSWGYPTSKNLSYWYNVNRRSNYNQSHYHPGALLSGVIYLKVPSHSGNIVFIRSSNEADRMDFITEYQLTNNIICPDNSNINVLHWEVPQENLLIIFPGHLQHQVDQNISTDKDDARISLSFNYFL